MIMNDDDDDDLSDVFADAKDVLNEHDPGFMANVVETAVSLSSSSQFLSKRTQPAPIYGTYSRTRAQDKSSI